MIFAIIIGVIGGVISGMGMGGGTILIPLVTTILHFEQKVAQSINLIAFIPMAIISVIIHIKNKMVCIKIAGITILFGIVGTILGSWLAYRISGNLLRKMFGIFLLIIGVYQFILLLLGSKTNNDNQKIKNRLKVHIWHN